MSMDRCAVAKQHAVGQTACPSCAAVGRVVADKTIHAMLEPTQALSLLAVGRRFCGTPSCEIVYYGDVFPGRRAPRDCRDGALHDIGAHRGQGSRWAVLLRNHEPVRNLLPLGEVNRAVKKEYEGLREGGQRPRVDRARYESDDRGST